MIRATVCLRTRRASALALVAEEFALLVVDIQMPGMNGFELAQMIKQRQKTAGVPIIFLTAYYSEDRHVLEATAQAPWIICTSQFTRHDSPIESRRVRRTVPQEPPRPARANRTLMIETTVCRRAECSYAN